MSLLLLLAAAPILDSTGKPVPLDEHGLPIVREAPPPQSPPTQPGAAFAECRDCPEMVVLPKGKFVMGSTDEERKKLHVMAMFDKMETPRHRVTIGYTFAVGRYAVTFDQWDACVADGGCNGYRPDDASWGRGRRPVINVNFADATSYASWPTDRPVNFRDVAHYLVAMKLTERRGHVEGEIRNSVHSRLPSQW